MYMVPYINSEGVGEDSFLRCSTCSAVIPIHELKYESELDDFVDVETANKPASFEVVEHSRRRTFQRNTDSRTGIEQQEIPKLGNKPDTDLENMLRDTPSVVTSIIDEDIDSGQEQEGDFY